MPNTGANVETLIHSRFADRRRLPTQAVASRDPSVQKLLAMNAWLVNQNRQLAIALVQPTPAALPVIHLLTPRQQQVMALVLEGQCSKRIAFDLNISRRTVENHRAEVMRRTGATSLPALARLALGLGENGDIQIPVRDRSSA